MSEVIKAAVVDFPVFLSTIAMVLVVSGAKLAWSAPSQACMVLADNSDASALHELRSTLL